MGYAATAAAAVLVAVVLLVVLVVLALVCSASASPVAARVAGGAAATATDDFPYWAGTLPPAAEMFAGLRRSCLRGDPSPDGPVLTRTYPGSFRRADAISNHFTEAARVDCRSGGARTPREAWTRMHRRVLGREATNEALREKVYGATRECNIFNPAFARWVLGETVGPGARVLDPSAGWGDRLIGALAAGAASYDGFDPNPRLGAGYREIVDALGGGRHAAFRVTEAPFEEAELAAGAYDIAFTSPPYFAYEEYVAPGAAGADAQSAGRYPDYEAWVARMYRPYLANAYRAVRPGGWVVLYIEDIRLGKKHYPLRALTKEIMAGLGARPATNFGLRVVADEDAKFGVRRFAKNQPRARVRWALGWRKPEA